MPVIIIAVNIPDVIPDPQRRLAERMRDAAAVVEMQVPMAPGELRHRVSRELLAKWDIA